MKQLLRQIWTSLVNPIIAFFMCTLVFSSLAQAELTIKITKGVDDPTVIAVVPFHYAGRHPLKENVADIVTNDLRRSGLFVPLGVENMLSTPSEPKDVVYRDWRLLGGDYLVIGNIAPKEKGYQLIFSLFDVLSQKAILLNKSITVGTNGLRDMAHYVSDAVYQAITGIRGAFSTDIIYVEYQKSARRYRLMRADVDGARPQQLVRSAEPLLSPAWSPDGQSVAYVSFESGRPAIFIQQLQSGQREKITNFKGLNGAPAWSPDGKKLALVLSKDGNPEIYVFDLRSRQFTRLTHHLGIDTEPVWTKDGRSILFTSNRGGKPQIYQLTLGGGLPQRLTFEGSYNARPQVTPDGKAIIMVHQTNDIFHIARQELESGRVTILTKTRLDESPSVAPNGASLIYATKSNGKGVLASVSMDAGTTFLLPSTVGDVRDPAWSPFFK